MVYLSGRGAVTVDDFAQDLDSVLRSPVPEAANQASQFYTSCPGDSVA